MLSNMNFTEKKKEHIDKEAYKVLSLFEDSDEENESIENRESSSKHQETIDWSDKVIDSPTVIGTTVLDKTVAVRECYKGKCIGLNEDNYREFLKLTTTIYNDNLIKSQVSLQFIEKKSLEWFFKSCKEKKVEVAFSTFILDAMQDSLQELKIYFHVLYLDIQKPFNVGHVKFEYFTKEYFDLKEAEKKETDPEIEYASIKYLRQKIQGKVLTTFIVKAEPIKAEEIAFENCALAVDVLKMCFDTADAPELKLSFDIDIRVKESGQSEVLSSTPDAIVDLFTTHLYRLPSHHFIGDNEMVRMHHRQFQVFHSFLLNLKTEKTELEQLIVNGIKRYGNAISLINLHQRIVELFTILESLLLVDENSPIIESVTKYCSKLISKKPMERKGIIDTLKIMYKVRSGFIHHAKEGRFEMQNLFRLQHIVRMLLAQLIVKSKSHATKQSLLQEIEEAILRAY